VTGITCIRNAQTQHVTGITFTRNAQTQHVTGITFIRNAQIQMIRKSYNVETSSYYKSDAKRGDA
jgi:hypothetical protein